MPIEEGFFHSNGGLSLFYRFQAGEKERNPLVLLHGHGDHSGRYVKFFSRLEDLRLPIAAFDFRGCGRSEGERIYVSEFDEYVNDVSCFVEFLKTRYQLTRPVQLLGHSLGGLVALSAAHQERVVLSKLLLSSPLLGLRASAPLILFGTLLSSWVPKYVFNNPVQPPFLTHDSAEVERYRTDPLIQRKITARLGHEILKRTEFFKSAKVSLRVPVYILMAELDYVVDPKATRQFFERLEAPKKELEVFKGFFHDTYNETGQDQYFTRLRRCLAEE